MIVLNEAGDRFVVLSKEALSGDLTIEFIRPDRKKITKAATVGDMVITYDGISYPADQSCYFVRTGADLSIAGVWKARVEQSRNGGTKILKSSYINFIVEA